MSVQINAQIVNELRQRTGVGLLECKKALAESNGDVEKAIIILRAKGMASAVKKADRAAEEGTIQSYIHGAGRVGVLVEVKCETDFVAKNSEFQQLAKDICMQIAASSPLYVKREDVPEELIAKEKEVAVAQIEGTKPPAVVNSIVQGKLDKWFKQICLLEQDFIKNPDITIKELLIGLISKMGENIMVSRFARFQIGH